MNTKVDESSTLAEMSLEEFSQVLGSNAPAPGGGSVAALSGTVGADLVSMVCGVSIGKEGCEAFDAEFNATLPKAKKLSKSLLKRVDLDTQAFNAVMAAFKLPKLSDEEKKKRTEAIQRGYKQAVQSPLNIARESLEVMRLADKLFGKSNPNALSDLGVATKQAHAGLQGAVMNVKINLPSIKDDKFRSATNSEVSSLLKEGHALTERADEYLSKHIG